MAKVNPTLGKMVGKIGGIVYSVSKGQQVMREKPISVANPQTAAQVAQRSKMKLVTQLAAQVSGSIFYPGIGAVSGRNQFVAANLKQAYYSGDKASIILDNVQLADGNAGIPALHVVRSINQKLQVSFTEEVSSDIVGIYFCVYKKTDEGRLALYGQKLVRERDETYGFMAEFPTTTDELVVWAVGIKAASASSKAAYYNFSVSNGVDAASLLSEIMNSTTGLVYSATRGVTLYRGETETESVQDGQARVYVTAGNGGTATGGGIFAIGDSVTVTATPSGRNTFLGWQLAGQPGYVSTDASYTFTLEGMTDLVAMFEIASGDGTDES